MKVIAKTGRKGQMAQEMPGKLDRFAHVFLRAAATNIVIPAIQANTPKVTGALAASFYADEPKAVRVHVFTMDIRGLERGLFVDRGTGIYGDASQSTTIVPRSAEKLVFDAPDGSGLVFTPSVEVLGQKPQKFISRAMQQARPLLRALGLNLVDVIIT